MANPVIYPFTSLQADATGADSNHPVTGTDFMGQGTANDLAGWVRLIETYMRQIDTNLEWERWQGLNAPQSPSSAAPVYVSATSFTLTNDWTTASAGNYPSIAIVGRRIKAFVSAGTVYGTISSAIFSGGTTTVVVTMDVGMALDFGLSEVQWGSIIPPSATGSNVPPSIVAGLVLYSGTTTGTDNYAVTVTPVPSSAPAPASLAALTGIPLLLQFSNANSGASTPTLAVNGFTAANIVGMVNSLDSQAVGTILAGGTYLLIYNGANFLLVAGAGGTNALFINGTVTTDTPPTNGETLISTTVGGASVWQPGLPQAAGGYDSGALGSPVTPSANTPTTLITVNATAPTPEFPTTTGYRMFVEYFFATQTDLSGDREQPVFWANYNSVDFAVNCAFYPGASAVADAGGVGMSGLYTATIAAGASVAVTFNVQTAGHLTIETATTVGPSISSYARVWFVPSA